MYKIFLLILVYAGLHASVSLKNVDIEADKKYTEYNQIINDLKNLKSKNAIIHSDLTGKDIDKLILKMNINQNKGYITAYKRDLLILSTIKNIELYNNMINKLLTAIQKFKDKKYLFNITKNTKNNLIDLKFKKMKADSPLSEEYNKAFDKYVYYKQEIVSRIEFIQNNLDKLSTKINLFNIDKIILKIDNKFNFINQYLSHYLNVTIGKLFVLLTLYIVLYVARFIALPIIVKIINKLILNEDINDAKIKLSKSLKIPVNLLSINVFMQISLFILNIDRFDIYIEIVYWGILFLLINNVLDDIIELYSEKLLKKFPDIRKEVILFFKRIVAIVSIIACISIFLSKLGVELTALLGGVGVIGLGASLAFKDTFSNFIGSVNIIFDKTFSVGDWIEVDNVEGTVIEVGMRQTRIRGFANNEYSIPNAIIANSTINNWSKRKIGRRIKFKVGLTYGTSIDKVKKIKDEILKILEEHKDISNRNLKYSSFKKSSLLIRKEDDYGVKNTLLVFIDELNNYSIDILVYAFTKTTKWEEWLKIKEDIIIEIVKIVEKNNAEFAFPTQTIELKTEN